MAPSSKHASLEKDEHANEAAWQAAKGAAWGGTKVCSIEFANGDCEMSSSNTTESSKDLILHELT
jgi:hypothetical protein